MNDLITQVVLAVIPAILAITLHEAAHGYAALALGDDTAQLAGRLSLNPLRHVDRTGTILLPGFLLIAQLLTIGRVEFMFGWAKPVPIGAWKFRNPRGGMAIVAAAGPAANFVLAWLGGLALYLVPVEAVGTEAIIQQLFVNFILFNLVLGLFNLLPIPPLDGGRIVVGILPAGLAMRWARMERAGILIVLLGVFLLPTLARQFGYNIDPVRQALGAVLPWALRVVLFLSGHDIGGSDGSYV
jgi:Zn-dependent protease